MPAQTPQPAFPFWLQEKPWGISLAVNIQAGAKRNACLRTADGQALKVQIHAPAVEGAANQALIAFFATLLHVRKSQIRLLKGQFHRSKVLAIDRLSGAEAWQMLLKHLEPINKLSP